MQPPNLLPSYTAHAETTQLLRPLAVMQQQQLKQPRQWKALLEQVASRKAAAAFYALLVCVLVWFVAAGRARPTTSALHERQKSALILSGGESIPADAGLTAQTGNRQQYVAAEPPHQQGTQFDGGTGGSHVTTGSGAGHSNSCAYGSQPGSWVSEAATGSKWQLLDPDCQLSNWLVLYASAAHAAQAVDQAADNTTALPSGAASVVQDTSGDGAISDQQHSGSTTTATTSTTTTTAAGGAAPIVTSNTDILPAVNILLLSDSVDRYIVQHVCDYLKGTKHTIRLQHHHLHPAEAPVEASQQQPSAGENGSVLPEDSSPAGSSSPAADGASERVPASPGPSNLNITAYAFHTCQLPDGVPLKLASSYFPGVHPTGPFHRGLAQNYAARIDAAVALWEEYAGAGQPPHVVGVASALWDVARLWMHERKQLDGPELSRPLLQGWMANFSSVVHYSRKQLPQAQLWLTHTTMLPAHNFSSGYMAKPYLGRRYFIEQLNAAAVTAAKQLSMQVVDYAAVSRRFMEGQAYLTDLIHPNAEVALEVFNVMLNLALQSRGL